MEHPGRRSKNGDGRLARPQILPQSGASGGTHTSKVNDTDLAIADTYTSFPDSNSATVRSSARSSSR